MKKEFSQPADNIPFTIEANMTIPRGFKEITGFPPSQKDIPLIIEENRNYPEVIFDYDRLYDLAEKNKEKFKSAKPFQHIMFDNFLEKETYNFIRDNHQKGEDGGSGEDPARCLGKFVLENSISHRNEKLFFASRLFYQFAFPDFTKFLNILTGIDDLELDVDFLEGGYTTVERGGHLQVHKDFTHSRRTGLERRLNFFVYLNDDWQEEWGSSLSLWDIKTGNKVSSYLPIGNRCVIFQASNIAYHGHPEPLLCPKNVSRKSFGLYYYTKSTGIPEEEIHFLREELN